MRKFILACALALLATSAQAQTLGVSGIPPYDPRMKMLPPPPYHKPYGGTATIYRLATPEELYKACRTKPIYPLACALRYSSQRCEIYIMDDEHLKAAQWPYEVILRHEFGHCNDWPADHQGSRTWDDAEKW